MQNRLLVHSKKKKGGFTQIDNNLLQFCPDTISPTAWLVYLHLLSLPKTHNPSIEGLAKKRRLSISTTKRCVRELQQAELLRITQTGQRCFVWEVFER